MGLEGIGFGTRNREVVNQQETVIENLVVGKQIKPWHTIRQVVGIRAFQHTLTDVPTDGTLQMSHIRESQPLSSVKKLRLIKARTLQRKIKIAHVPDMEYTVRNWSLKQSSTPRINTVQSVKLAATILPAELPVLDRNSLNPPRGQTQSQRLGCGMTYTLPAPSFTREVLWRTFHSLPLSFYIHLPNY